MALWNAGFRPFYLLAGGYAAVSVLLWALQFAGMLPFAFLRGPVWHAHEMLFGYTMAVMAGFLLTAVRVWTNQPTPRDAPLMWLAGLWIAGRVLTITPLALTAAVVNAAFPLCLAAAIGIPLWRARNARNYFFAGLLVLMSVLVLSVHLALPAGINRSPAQGLQLALDIVLFVMAVMGGRVIPMFTNNGVPGAGAMRYGPLEKAALGAVILLFAADLLGLPGAAIAVLALAAALLHGARLMLWNPWRTRARPLVWVLHAGYAWIVAHLALRGMAALDLVSGSYATHALTTGAIGGLTLGMMTRTARGHTGRALEADGFELAMFVLVNVAAALRVFAGIAIPDLHGASVLASGVFWAGAFALYAVRYWPVLTRPRVDGRPE